MSFRSSVHSLIDIVDIPGRAAWSQRYRELVAYQEEHGNCRVPKAQGKLGRWVARQREQRKKNGLSEARQVRLDAIGFVWNTNEDAWDMRYEKLKEYVRQHGNTRVPTAEHDLGVWVAKQRQLQRQEKLLRHRKERLDTLGFVWSTPTMEWNDKYEALVEWKNCHGDCRVPFNEGELGWWVNTQRQRQRKGKLPKDREDKLNEIGFIWNPQNTTQNPNINSNSNTAVHPTAASISNLVSNNSGAGPSSAGNINMGADKDGTHSNSSSYRRRKRRISDDGTSSMGSKRHQSDLSDKSNLLPPRFGMPDNSSQSSFDSFRDSDRSAPTTYRHRYQ